MSKWHPDALLAKTSQLSLSLSTPRRFLVNNLGKCHLNPSPLPLLAECQDLDLKFTEPQRLIHKSLLL